jgi:hypothetical protein
MRSNLTTLIIIIYFIYFYFFSKRTSLLELEYWASGNLPGTVQYGPQGVPALALALPVHGASSNANAAYTVQLHQ